MANYSAIKAAVNAYIKANGRKEITGLILNAVLNATIDSLGRFYQFAGGALPTDDPGTPDQNVCYLAGEPGVYTNFGGITIGNEEVALLFWDGEWRKQSVLYGIQEVEASVDNQVGTPSVDVSYSEGQLILTFHNLKGEQGIPGESAGFGTIGADINGGVGTPGVSVESSGDNTSKNLMFHFTNLKGETGVTSVIATIDDTSGTPSCQVSLVNGVLTLAFSGLKGLKGDTGVSADYPITIYNGLDSDATDMALSAAQGKALGGRVGQLEREVGMISPLVMETTNIVPADQTFRNYQINSSNQYTTNSSFKHIIFGVQPGQKVEITAEATHVCQMAWLRDDAAPVSGGTPHFVTGTQRFDLAAGQTGVFVVPDGAAFMYVYAGASPFAFLPTSITIRASKVPGVQDNLESDSHTDALAAAQGQILERAFSYVDLEITRTTQMQISDSNPHYFVATTGTNYAVYSVPVSKGDIVRVTTTDTAAHTIRLGFATEVVTSKYVFNYIGGTLSQIDELLVAPFDGLLCVYHLTGYFGDLRFRKVVNTSAGDRISENKSLLDVIANAIGLHDYEKIIPSWKEGYFQYYNQAGDAVSANFSHTGQIHTNGRKWLYFTQNVSTGTGSAGIRFFDSEGTGVGGFRQIIQAAAAGVKRVLLEIPENTSYFIATCYTSLLGDWFAYIFDDDRLAELIRNVDETRHLKICLLGNSYTADAWRYVPTMLLKYGITMESFFYYRGQGSLYDLDTQWTDDSPTGESDYDHAQHARITFYVNSANDPIWREWTRLSASAIVNARKWDIISLQQGGNRCKDLETYSPSLQNIIDKIQEQCPYPHTLCWYMAYNGSTQNVSDADNQESLDTQKYIIKKYPFKMIIPAASAVFNAQKDPVLSELGSTDYKHMYASDGVHMQEGLPCYLVACSVVQSLLDIFKPGMSVLGDQFRATAENIENLGMPQTANGSSTGVTEDNCKKAQQVAIYASKNPYDIDLYSE